MLKPGDPRSFAGLHRLKTPGQPTGMSRRGNAARPMAVTATATRVSQMSGVAENVPPGTLGTWAKGERSRTCSFHCIAVATIASGKNADRPAD
jgi:hypothetical protein